MKQAMQNYPLKHSLDLPTLKKRHSYLIEVRLINPLSANPTLWSNILKQFVGNLRQFSSMKQVHHASPAIPNYHVEITDDRFCTPDLPTRKLHVVNMRCGENWHSNY